MKLSFTGLNVALVLLLVPGIARADNPDLMSLIGASSTGAGYASLDNNGDDELQGNASIYNLSSSDPNSFAVDYGDRGVIRGHGRCSTQDGIELTNLLDTITDETGQAGAQYCYCGLDSYTPQNGSAQSLSGPWVFNSDDGDADDCALLCSAFCGDSLTYNLPFRAAMFNAYAPSSSASGDAITTRTYVDNLLSGKQAKITTTGTNKLMTYGSSAGNIGTKDIVSTLGTSTTATTVPEVGPIVTGLNGKQNTVNGTANYVMTGTGTAGTLGEKPVYSTTNNYTSALVTAQTINTAAATAANSELSCIDNDCLLWQINTSGPAGISTRVYIDSAIPGTSSCYRSLNGSNENGTCNASTLSYIGESRSGKWGVVFPYGDVIGISTCIDTVKGTSVGDVATDAQSTTLDNHSTHSGRYCWCKMMGPAESTWIYAGDPRTSGNCTTTCTSTRCATDVKNNADFRTAMFGSVQ